MKKLLILTAALAALCTPAAATEDDRDNAVAIIYWYSQHCRAVPAPVTKWAESWTQKRSNQVNGERVKVRAEMDALGITAWCTKITPPLQAYMQDGLRAVDVRPNPYFSAELPGNGSNRFVLRGSNIEPDWRSMTVDECVATIDTELAKRNQELSTNEMFIACDSLTKGFARQAMTRPRQGTAAGDRVSECIRRYYARTPLHQQQPERLIAVMCQRPADNVPPAVANDDHAKSAVFITIYGKFCNQSVPAKVTEMIDIYMQTHSQEFLSAAQEIETKFRWLANDTTMTNKWCDSMKPQLTKILDQLDAEGRKLEGR